MSDKKNSFLDLDDCVNQYLKNLKNYKVLSRKEERYFIEDYKINGNINSRNMVIQCNLKYACSLANKYRGKGVEFSELIAEANDGLMEAIEKFDLSQETKFITYAKWWIIQRLISSINNNYKHSGYELPTDRNNQENEDDENYEQNKNDYDNLIIDEIDEVQNKYDKKYYVNTLLNLLTERERDIICRYYGLYGKKENLYNISDSYNLTSERIRQIMEGGMRKIRSYALE